MFEASPYEPSTEELFNAIVTIWEFKYVEGRAQPREGSLEPITSALLAAAPTDESKMEMETDFCSDVFNVMDRLLYYKLHISMGVSTVARSSVCASDV